MNLYFSKWSILLLFLFVVGCQSKEKQIASYQIKINENQATDMSLSDFFPNVTYVPLETSDKSLLGYVTKLEIWDNRIYVLDQLISRALFVFDLKTGRFLYKIDRKGNGPGEYVLLTDFFIDKKKRTIHLVANGRKVIHFDYNGKFVSEEDLPLAQCSFMLPLGNSGYCLLYQPTADTDYLLYFSDLALNVRNKQMKKPEGWERIARASNIYYSSLGDGRYLYSYVCSTILYELATNMFIPKYEFQPPSYRKLTEKKVANYSLLNDYDFVMKTLDYFSLDSYFEIGSKLFVEFYLGNKPYWGIFDINEDSFKYAERDYEKIHDERPYPMFLCQPDSRTLAGVIMPNAFPINNDLGVDENSNPVIGIYEWGE